MSQIIRFTIFKSNPFGHGGEKRSCQITELLSSYGLSWLNLPTLKKCNFNLTFLANSVLSLTLVLRFVLKRQMFIPLGQVIREAYRGALLVCQLSDKTKYRGGVFLWEGTKPEHLIYVLVMKHYACKVIGLPHNLESLVPGQVSALTGKRSPDWFNEELKVLKLCDVIFCVSKAETLLLEQFGIEAHYLPYYAPVDAVNWLKEIRQARDKRKASKPGKKLVMLGSAINPPTRSGMLNRLSFFSRGHFKDLELHVVGYGTAQLVDGVSPPNNIHLHGALSKEALKDVLVGAHAVLVHQPATAGALTRIHEMMIAGVPVVANFEAARNYYNLPGVYMYASGKGLLRILSKRRLAIPREPDDYAERAGSFVEVVNRFLSAR